MNVKGNLIIFSTDNEERKDVRRLKEKKLQVALDCQNNLPTFELNENEYIKDSANKRVEELCGTSKFYIEQLYTWGNPQDYTSDNQMFVTYLVVINKSNVKKLNGISFYDIQIDTDTQKSKRVQDICLKNDNKEINYKILTKRSTKKQSVEYVNELVGDALISQLTAVIIHTGIKRLRNRIDNTNIAFSFLDKEFSISELQQVYEIILDKKLVPANFRKKIEPMIKKTEKIVKESAYRPSQKYVFNTDYLEYWV